MSEYIKREDAIFIALQQPFFQNSMATEIRAIKGINIVRCKECAYRDAVACDMYPTEDDDFCSYGERSE